MFGGKSAPGGATAPRLQDHPAGRIRAFFWPLVIVVVVAGGWWGFRHPVLNQPPPPGPPAAPLSWYESLYQTLRLFTLNLDVPRGTSPPWYLHVAAFLAALVVVRTLVELFRNQLRAVLVRSFLKPSLVVFGANERSAVLVAAAKRGRRRGPIVVVDDSARALVTVTTRGVWTLEADARTDASLGRILQKAHDVVVITGDNARNSAITSAVLAVRPPPPVELFVEVEEPGLARTLEQGGQRADVSTTTFSAAGLAAVAVLDEMGGIEGVATPAGQDDPPTITLFGTGALVDAMVLELHHRRRVQLLEAPGTARAVPRVLLFGPDASGRCQQLAALMGTELEVLDLDPLDVDLGQVVDLDPSTARHLARHPRPRVVMVLTPTDLDGGGLAITLARHLLRGPEIVLVTESISDPFGSEISEQTRDSPTLAQVRVHKAPVTAYDLTTLHAERMTDRLARALYEVDHPHGAAWSGLEDSAPERYREYRGRSAAAVAAKLDRPAGAGPAPAGSDGKRQALRRTALVSLDPPEVVPLRVLGFPKPIALARAGLHVDFRSVDALVHAGKKLRRDGNPAAFGVWAEVARLRTDPVHLDEDLPMHTDARPLDDAQCLVLLRRTLLGDPEARLALLGDRTDVPPLGQPTDPRTPFVVLGGAQDADENDGSAARTALRLSQALKDLPVEAAVWVTPVVRSLLISVLPAAAPRLHTAHGGSELGAALAMWTAVLKAGHHAEGIRVVALPGTSADELALARALGARIGRVEAPEGTNLNQVLLNGSDQILPLPDDPATVRAFLRPSCWPNEYADRREPLARELHELYVVRHRTVKSASDPALRAWSTLSPWLRRSNLAVVDDIPTKLAVLGLRLEERPIGEPEPGLVTDFTANIDRLAELEHGRFIVERLLSGWTSGVRDPARFVSPHLLPWTELSDEAKGFDRDVMRNVPMVLAHHGLGAGRASG